MLSANVVASAVDIGGTVLSSWNVNVEEVLVSARP